MLAFGLPAQVAVKVLISPGKPAVQQGLRMHRLQGALPPELQLSYCAWLYPSPALNVAGGHDSEADLELPASVMSQLQEEAAIMDRMRHPNLVSIPRPKRQLRKCRKRH